MSYQIDPNTPYEELTDEEKAYLAARENIIGVPNVHHFSKGEAPWPEGEAPINPGDSNALQMSYGTDLNTVGDQAHPLLTENDGQGALPTVTRVPLTDADHPEATTALEVEAAKQAAASNTSAGSKDYRNMTVAEMRDELEGRTDIDGNPLSKSGSKYELVLRLEENDQKGSAQETAQSLAEQETAQTDQDGDSAEE